ncbi:hypothetical protein [Chelativorans sp. AA-79]|uniref:hypothetical protein n=1 Tax=Chelativorans sp. AA-79 TaxID=3028735 RepID=UPI0023F979E9|nr:hypothetical protein [Chelativorans sp. AA-79]WEX11368.1 hypothetical protein PVE73_10745 [Chelativorans sp. AA-79]
MQKQFQELKRQLAELSETINKFESEAVQLRIVELLFDQARGGVNFFEPEGEAYEPGPSRARRGNGAARTRTTSSTSESRPDAGGATASGAVAALSQLVEGNYFKEKRTIGDIVKQCQDKFGAHYRSNAFSGPLSRLAKKGVLKREKNEEGNYVYHK